MMLLPLITGRRLPAMSPNERPPGEDKRCSGRGFGRLLASHSLALRLGVMNSPYFPGPRVPGLGKAPGRGYWGLSFVSHPLLWGFLICAFPLWPVFLLFVWRDLWSLFFSPVFVCVHCGVVPPQTTPKNFTVQMFGLSRGMPKERWL